MAHNNHSFTMHSTMNITRMLDNNGVKNLVSYKYFG